MPQVSVIVLTYNSDSAKLRQALCAIAAQKEVTIEVIISDDGSQRKDFSFVPAYVKKLGIQSYQILEHESNRGTVANSLSAVKAATGEYVVLTSPGDCLFDPYVLRDFYRFAQENNAPVCFGNAVFYTVEGGEVKTTRACGFPVSPQLYAPGSSTKQVKTAFFGGSWINGATYFHSRPLIAYLLEQVADVSKYVEDTPTTALALAQGSRLCYYDRNFVWYEDGTGVSTGGNKKWDALLHQDIQRSFEKLKKAYPDDPYADIAWRNISQDSRLRRIAGNILRHPVICARLALCRRAARKKITCTQADLARFAALLQTQ